MRINQANFGLIECFNLFLSNSAKVFVLNLTDPNRDPTEQFDKTAKYAFLLHGFIDHYPGMRLINNVGMYFSQVY